MITNFENIVERKLLNLLENFYVLTGMKICIFDPDGNEVCYYPERLSPFCEHIRKNKEINEKCLKCDRLALNECRKTKQAKIYTCHAGLTECVTPITVNGAIKGFIAIGQIRENESAVFPAEYGNKKELKRLYDVLSVIPRSKTESALYILNACAEYEYLKKYVSEFSEAFNVRLQRFINENTDKDLSVDALCREFAMTRRELYYEIKKGFDTTPGELVKEFRLRYATELLRGSEMPVFRIAEKAGIFDYNYFSKIFKKRYGVSPREYRKSSE